MSSRTTQRTIRLTMVAEKLWLLSPSRVDSAMIAPTATSPTTTTMTGLVTVSLHVEVLSAASVSALMNLPVDLPIPAPDSSQD